MYSRMRRILFQTRIRVATYRRLLLNPKVAHQVHQVIEILLKAIRDRKKIMIFGNGGSAAEAQHFVAELVCQFEKKRRAVAAIALTADTTILTAQSNDFGFGSVFSRQIEALCLPGDIVIGFTTSDVAGQHSRSIFNAFKTAKKMQARTIGFFSTRTRKLLSLTDLVIIVPAKRTALIQEVHLAIIHIICGEIEKNL